VKLSLPNPNRLSVLLASVLLLYALARLLENGHPALEWNFFGLIFSLPLNLNAAAALLAAGLTASGMDGLLQTHPSYSRETSPEHWLLPAFSAFIIGVPLYNLPDGPGWWLTFSLGGVLLLLTLLSEYITQEITDPRYPLASGGLTALGFALYLALCAALEYSGARLAVLALTVFPAAVFASLRALHLRTGEWRWGWALGIGLVCLQAASALHYWPLSPAQYGLMALGPLYALTEFAFQTEEQAEPWRAAAHATGLTVLFWTLAWFAL